MANDGEAESFPLVRKELRAPYAWKRSTESIWCKRKGFRFTARVSEPRLEAVDRVDLVQAERIPLPRSRVSAASGDGLARDLL